MPARRFALWNVLGGIVWTVGILIAGRLVGEKLHIDRYVLPVVWLAVVVSVISVLLEVRRNKRRRQSM
jgi:membrane-associated protein